MVNEFTKNYGSELPSKANEILIKNERHENRSGINLKALVRLQISTKPAKNPFKKFYLRRL